jgi:hypothetical protein
LDTTKDPAKTTFDFSFEVVLQTKGGIAGQFKVIKHVTDFAYYAALDKVRRDLAEEFKASDVIEIWRCTKNAAGQFTRDWKAWPTKADEKKAIQKDLATAVPAIPPATPPATPPAAVAQVAAPVVEEKQTEEAPAYRIATHSTASELAGRVNGMIAVGYEPRGQLLFANGLFVQAMYLKKKTPVAKPVVKADPSKPDPKAKFAWIKLQALCYCIGESGLQRVVGLGNDSVFLESVSKSGGDGPDYNCRWVSLGSVFSSQAELDKFLQQNASVGS